MRTRTAPLIALLAVAGILAGCESNRGTAGQRADIDLGNRPENRITVEKDGSVKSSLRIEKSLSRIENGFLVVEVHVRNTTSRNIPCEWRTTFRDAEGFDVPVTSNPWAPAVINSNQTVPLRKTAPLNGAETATFYIREAAPIRN